MNKTAPRILDRVVPRAVATLAARPEPTARLVPLQGVRVLQTASAPAQRSLFLRPDIVLR